MSRALTIGLFFSLAAHAVILLPWVVQSRALPFDSSDTAPAVMNFAMADPQQPIKQPNPFKISKQPQTRDTPSIEDKTTTQSNDSTPNIQDAEQNDLKLRSKLLANIQTDFARHFYYPPLARRQGWQGHVLLGFAVESNGTISHARIENGSGYPILDESALAALLEVRTIPGASAWLNGRRLELNLPVEYRLTGG